MNSECRGRFILLDLCHPMKTETVKSVIEAVQNALVLCLSFPLNGLELGIFVLNSDFKIIQPPSDLRQNYETIHKALQDLLQITKEDTKVTVQKYKELTRQLLDRILKEYFAKLENSKCSKHLEAPSIQIAIITKKTASVLVEILTDILKKLQETNLMDVVKKFKIVQILNENEELYKMQQKNNLIECTTCLSHPHYLTYFIKDWLLNPEEYLEIVLNKHMNFSLKCDVYNCIIEPISPLLNQNIDSRTFSFKKIPSLGKSNPKSLEVISKIPISRFCSTLVFGVPRRITAALNKTLSWAECQINRQLFKGLCLELQNTEQGLLTRSRIQTEEHEFFTFQFIISDGDTLLMNDVAPEELYLPKGVNSLKAVHVDEEAISFVKTSLENIKTLNEYCPRDFASGIHEYLTTYLIRANRSKIPSKNFNSWCHRKFQPRPDKNDQNDAQDTENKYGQSTKKQKFNPEAKLKEAMAIHPALLPQDMVQKYRKINSKVFNLPELSQDFTKDLVHWY